MDQNTLPHNESIYYKPTEHRGNYTNIKFQKTFVVKVRFKSKRLHVSTLIKDNNNMNMNIFPKFSKLFRILKKTKTRKITYSTGNCVY